MEKQFIPYELALKLKQLGFDEECLAWYVPSGPTGYVFSTNKHQINSYPKHEITPVPLWQQAFDFFREKHGLYLWIHQYKNDFGFGDGKGEIHKCHYKTYEEAGLECLKKLIEIIELSCQKPDEIS